MPNIAETIASRLPQVRREANMSQTDLKSAVERFGGSATKTAISNVERGDRTLKAEELVQWSIAMNTRPSMILTDRDPETMVEVFPGLETDSRRLRRFLEGRYPLNAGWDGLAPTPAYFGRVQDDIREASRYGLLVHLRSKVEDLTDAFSAKRKHEDRVDQLLGEVIATAELAREQWKTGEISTFWEPEA